MNDIATKLLEELGGIGTSGADEPTDQTSDVLLESLSAESDDLDKWHVLLVDLAYALNASFRDVHYWKGVKNKQDAFLQLVKTLRELERMRYHDKTVHISYRGSKLNDLAANLDYIIQFGDVVIDYTVVADLIKRQGIRFKHFEGRIKKAFEAFAAQAISSLSLKIPGRSQRSLELMRVALRIFSCFHQAAETSSPITFERNDKPCSLVPIVDEYGQPDPNLTLVAALNYFDETTMQELVRKVAPMAGGNHDAGSDQRFSNVYQTLFKVKNLREKLIRPPLEFNSNRSLAMFMCRGETAPDEIVIKEFDRSAGFAAFDIDPATLKNAVAQFAKAAFKGSMQHAKLAIKSVFSQDYNQVNWKILGQRIKLLSHLFRKMGKNTQGQKIMDSVLETLQTGFDQVPDELLDDLVVQDNLVKFWTGEKEISVGETDINLLDVLEVSKRSSIDRKKSRPSINPYKKLGDEDYQALAERFGLSAAEAAEIVALFEKCFDKQRNFQKTAFAGMVPDFMRFENVIFEILWEFLKQTPERKDRLPFLNSLQFLVKETRQRVRAIKILLTEFMMNPLVIGFPDRNAVMLANLFLRTYNKERNIDIEITPEEVLLVKIGLDQKAAEYAAWRVDGEHKKFLEKIVMIRRRLVESLSAAQNDEGHLPVRFLLPLEREVHIFLALAGGDRAAMVLRSALKVYGNPESQVYHLPESAALMTVLIQHLAALIRGFGRVGTTRDLALLDEIRECREGFLDFGKDQRHEILIKRTMGWIDTAKNEIGARPAQEQTPAKIAPAVQPPATGSRPLGA
ncbi:MAG: hypothetical protein P8X90_04110 [Desulfobacterales bacterium]